MAGCIPTKFFLHLVFLLWWGRVVSESNRIQSNCDWQGRGDHSSPRASVLVVHLTGCRTGRLVWRKPFGGVEVSFASDVPMATQGSYQVCLSTKNRAINVFERHGNSMVRLDNNKNMTSSEICVTSRTKRIVILFDSLNKSVKKSAVFWYWTSFSRNGSGPLRAKDCKMCSYDQLVRSFCDGDFAVHGHVTDVFATGGREDRGEAVVVAQKVIHQTYNIFKKSTGNETQGLVDFPLYCHWRKRTKHGFLFTGAIKKGVGPVLQCRIKFSRWKRVYRKNICENVRALM